VVIATDPHGRIFGSLSKSQPAFRRNIVSVFRFKVYAEQDTSVKAGGKQSLGLDDGIPQNFSFMLVRNKIIERYF
jgi:hypothetical protein